MKECVNEEFVVLYMFGSALSESSHLLNFIIVQYLYRTQNPEQEIVSSAAHGDSGTNSGSSGGFLLSFRVLVSYLETKSQQAPDMRINLLCHLNTDLT